MEKDEKVQASDGDTAGGASPESLLPIDEHVEEVSIDGEKVHRRGVYLLPNLFTTGALFSGFYASVSAMSGHLEAAAVAIFIAMILDAFDGRIARMTHTESAFGAEYDSLSDMVSFGIAPALTAFSWALSSLGKLGWAMAFLYVAGAALRLARFNTQIDTADKNYFTGLASPSAAALVAGMVWAFHGDPLGQYGAFIAGTIVAFLGMLMVSNVPYYSFKGIDIRGRVPFVVILALVLAIVIITVDPPRVLLGGFVLYACSGPILLLLRMNKSPSSNS